MSTVIIGGGIIGLSVAYHLSRASNHRSITIIDSASSLLLSASGYAGGFLASDWFSPPVASLGALSFDLHRKLAREHDGQRKWGYTGCHVYSLSIASRGVAGRRGKKGKAEDWLSQGTSRASVASEKPLEMLNPDGTPAWITPQEDGTVETIAEPDSCAQVEPRELCEWLLQQCEDSGVKVQVGEKATGFSRDAEGKVTKIQTSSEKGPAEYDLQHLVLAAGAWTPSVFEVLFPDSRLRIPVEPLAGYSLLFKSPRYKTPFLNKSKTEKLESGEQEQMAYGIFCAPSPHPGQWSYAPEAFARLARGGEPEVWIGGLNDTGMKLPETADEVKAMMDHKSLANLRQTTVQLTGRALEGHELNEDDLDTIREGLCFRPVSKRGVPIIAKVHEGDLGGLKMQNQGGVYIASGHGPWGISLSLGTGCVVSEMIQGEKTSADVRHLGLR